MYGSPVFQRWSEAQLVAAAKAGDDAALEYLLTNYGPLRAIIRAIKRKVDPMNAASLAEVESAARVAILRALRRFDPSRGVRFTTFAYRAIQGAVIEVVFDDGMPGRPIDCPKFSHVSIYAQPAAGSGEPAFERELSASDPGYGRDRAFDEMDAGAQEKAVRQFVSRLSPNQREVAFGVFWLEQSHASIGAARGTSRPAVTKTLHKILHRGARELAEYAPAVAA
jgi:RNA polymerase sigma factor (sigma-70 family)